MIIFLGVRPFGVILGWRVEPSIQGSDLCDCERSRAWSSNESAPARTNIVQSFSKKYTPSVRIEIFRNFVIWIANKFVEIQIPPDLIVLYKVVV